MLRPARMSAHGTVSGSGALPPGGATGRGVFYNCANARSSAGAAADERKRARRPHARIQRNPVSIWSEWPRALGGRWNYWPTAFTTEQENTVRFIKKRVRAKGTRSTADIPVADRDQTRADAFILQPRVLPGEILPAFSSSSRF